jgi:tetratricopeptide (TPR) repeat protein
MLYAEDASAGLKQADGDYRAGVAALARNDLSQAREDFEKVIRLAPQAEQGYSALGAVLVRLGETDKGIRDLQKALSILPSDNSAQLNLALAYLQKGANDKALPLLDRLENTAKISGHALPAYVQAAYGRALATTRPEAAIRKMEFAIGSEPANAEWRDELGSLYAKQQKWPQAEASFREAIRLNPQIAQAHFHLGIALETEHDANALNELKLASQLAPADEQIGIETGKALAASDHTADAIDQFRQVLKNDPASLEAAYQLALALQFSGDPQEAIPLFEKVIASEPANAEALTNLGMAYMQRQNAKDAVQPLQRAVKLAPAMVTARQDLAAAYIQLNQMDDAIEQLRAALSLAPNIAALHYDLGLAFKMKDDAGSAIPELEAAEKLNPQGHEAPYALGMLYMQTARYEDAARELDRSLKLQSQNGDGWATLGSVYSKLDRLPEAASALQQAIEQNPGQPDPHLTLATVLVKQGKPADAAAERRRAAELMRTNMNHQRAEVAAGTANSLLQSGKTDEAIAQYKEALRYDPGYADAHSGLATALDRKGNAFAAAEERQKLQSLPAASQP